MKKLLLCLAFLSLALPASSQDFRKAAAAVTQPQSMEKVDVNYFDELSTLFEKGAVPAPADFKEWLPGELALKENPLTMRKSRITTSFDGREYLVNVDAIMQQNLRGMNITATLPAMVDGSGQVTVRKSGSMLVARIKVKDQVVAYAAYGTAKQRRDSMAAPSGVQAAMLGAAPAQASNINSSPLAQPASQAQQAAPPQAAAPAASAQSQAAAAPAPEQQSVLHVNAPPPVAPVAVDASTPVAKPKTFTQKAVLAIAKVAKKAQDTAKAVGGKVVAFAKAHPKAMMAIGITAGVVAAGVVVFGCIQFGWGTAILGLGLGAGKSALKAIPDQIQKKITSIFKKKFSLFTKDVNSEIAKPDAPAPQAPQPPQQPMTADTPDIPNPDQDVVKMPKI